VNTLPEELLCTVYEMLKELESDKAAGRYVLWLRFTRVLKWKGCNKKSLLEFFRLHGEFFQLQFIVTFLTLCVQYLLCVSSCCCKCNYENRELLPVLLCYCCCYQQQQEQILFGRSRDTETDLSCCTRLWLREVQNPAHTRESHRI